MKTKLILLSSCILLLVSACSVNKRAHRPGYNVEWHSANPKAVKHPKLEKQDLAIEQQLTLKLEMIELEEEFSEAIEIAGIVALQEENPMAGGIPAMGFLQREVQTRTDRLTSIWDKESSPTDTSQEAYEQNISNRERLALKGFWLSLSGIMVTLVFTLLALFTVSGFAWFLLIVLPPLLFILGIVHSNRSLRLFRENPGSNYRRGFAKAGHAIGTAGIIIWLLLLLGIAMSGFGA